MQYITAKTTLIYKRSAKIKRLLYKELVNLKNSNNRKPLILKGVRQN